MAMFWRMLFGVLCHDGVLDAMGQLDFRRLVSLMRKQRWIHCQINHATFHVTQLYVSIAIEMAMFWRMLFGVLCHDGVLDTMGQLDFRRLVSQKRILNTDLFYLLSWYNWALI